MPRSLAPPFTFNESLLANGTAGTAKNHVIRTYFGFTDFTAVTFYTAAAGSSARSTGQTPFCNPCAEIVGTGTPMAASVNRAAQKQLRHALPVSNTILQALNLKPKTKMLLQRFGI